MMNSGPTMINVKIIWFDLWVNKSSPLQTSPKGRGFRFSGMVAPFCNHRNDSLLPDGEVAIKEMATTFLSIGADFSRTFWFFNTFLLVGMTSAMVNLYPGVAGALVNWLHGVGLKR